MQRARRRGEIEAISRMRFPVQADFGGQAVEVLGPVARFLPYKEQAQGSEDPFQLVVQPENGERFITLASCLSVGSKPLVTPMLPLRERPNLFAALGVKRTTRSQGAGEFPKMRSTSASVPTRPAVGPRNRMSP